MLRVVRDEQVGAVVRAIRHRRGWRLDDVSRRSGLSRALASDIEHGRFDRHTLRAARQLLAALDIRLDLEPRWRGPERDRLLDADHAALANGWKIELERRDWLAEAEVTFNIYGESGRIDLLGFHPSTATLLIVEIKAAAPDQQDLLRRLDVKVRHGRRVAERFGWRARTVVACLVLAEGRTNRGLVEQHPALFARFEVRGRSALAWLADPTRPARGLLAFRKLSSSTGGDGRRAGRQRMRLRGRSASVNTAAKAVDDRSDTA